jgi:hypothetical protein
MDLINDDPWRGTTHWIAPVSISIASPDVLTWIVPAGSAVRAKETRSGPLVSGPAIVANPVHLIDPSGQYARGQLWSGSVRPSARASVNVWSFRTEPLGHGTPQLTPDATTGECPCSQLTDMGCD